ncbi:serine hydrolase [Neolewinella antarctica]|uniref:beta-lactamase n=1 Tax=Neolewinella antarctica TaxID=442734 RepID=A0ABX0XGM1_9BACT|nr:serine hydrolase [Neolewinella antarctica]NJC28470.1 beta-lactamase class A [Neolewinella antarctica]
MAKHIFYVFLVASSTLIMSVSEYELDEYLVGNFRMEVFSDNYPVTDTTDLVRTTGRNLRSLKDSELQKQLKTRLRQNPVWKRLIDQKRLSVGIVDMSDRSRTKYAAVNGRHMMYAASLPKIAVLAAAHDAIERGELAESAEVKKDMRLMIAKSNNAATTRMIDRVGFENIERTMTAPDLKLYDPAYGGGLWVGKRYAAGGRRYPDPMKGISHAATTEQICRYFYKLANGELVSADASRKMRGYLVDPELHHKFVSVLDRVAPNAKVYRKSGSWSTFHADVAMVQGPDRNYIMTALVDDAAGESIVRQLGAVLDDMLNGQAK